MSRYDPPLEHQRTYTLRFTVLAHSEHHLPYRLADAIAESLPEEWFDYQDDMDYRLLAIREDT